MKLISLILLWLRINNFSMGKLVSSKSNIISLIPLLDRSNSIIFWVYDPLIWAWKISSVNLPTWFSWADFFCSESIVSPSSTFSFLKKVSNFSLISYCLSKLNWTIDDCSPSV